VTFSDAWIDTIDDPDFRALVDARSGMDTRRADKLFLLPPIELVRPPSAAKAATSSSTLISKAGFGRIVPPSFEPASKR
jgi:hypothetical protein